MIRGILEICDTMWLFLLIGILFVGVVRISALLFRVYSKAPDFWKLPYECYYSYCNIDTDSKNIFYY